MIGVKNSYNGNVATPQQVFSFDDLAQFPITGIQNALYIAIDSLETYAWDGAAYILLDINKPDEVVNFPTLSQFPSTGSFKTVYIADDTSLGYSWNGSKYFLLNNSNALTLQEVTTAGNITTNFISFLDGNSNVSISGNSVNYFKSGIGKSISIGGTTKSSCAFELPDKYVGTYTLATLDDFKDKIVHQITLNTGIANISIDTVDVSGENQNGKHIFLNPTAAINFEVLTSLDANLQSSNENFTAVYTKKSMSAITIVKGVGVNEMYVNGKSVSSFNFIKNGSRMAIARTGNDFYITVTNY